MSSLLVCFLSFFFNREETTASEISYESLLQEPQAKTVPTARDMVHYAMKLLLKEAVSVHQEESWEWPVETV